MGKLCNPVSETPDSGRKSGDGEIRCQRHRTPCAGDGWLRYGLWWKGRLESKKIEKWPVEVILQAAGLLSFVTYRSKRSTRQRGQTGGWPVPEDNQRPAIQATLCDEAGRRSERPRHPRLRKCAQPVEFDPSVSLEDNRCHPTFNGDNTGCRSPDGGRRS